MGPLVWIALMSLLLVLFVPKPGSLSVGPDFVSRISQT